MNIVQNFYDKLATQYDKLYFDWNTAMEEQSNILKQIFEENGFNKSAKILDCACGIGTQAIGMAKAGYDVTASDISEGELREAERRAEEYKVKIKFEEADFRYLAAEFEDKFDIIIAIDNALPHMLTEGDLEKAVKSMSAQLKDKGMLVASIRDYDSLLEEKPPYSPPYIHKTEHGQRVSFQTWEWKGNNYKLIQYIIDDEADLQINKFECEYRAVKRDELTKLFAANGFGRIEWKLADETGFFQPIVIAQKNI